MSDDPKAKASTTDLAAYRAANSPASLCIGRLIQWSPDEGALVDYPGNPKGPLQAQSVVAFDVDLAARTIDSDRGLVLSFEAGDWSKPVIMGLLQPAATAAKQNSPAVEVHADGERVTVKAAEQIELKCGEASIILTKAGKILLRGTYVSSVSTGAQRLKGASIEIN